MHRAEYKRLLTEAYDIDKPHPPERELAFYRDRLVEHGTPGIELMSGSGRFLAPLLVEGFDVDGVDASADMLAAAEQRCTGLPLTQYGQALDRLDLPRRYAFAFCGGGSFGLIVRDGEVAAALARIRDHLVPGGVLLLEVETPLRARSSGAWSGRWWRRPDGATITVRGTGRYDPGSQVEEAIAVYELFVDGRLVETELNDWVRRFWTAEQITGVLTAAGFADIVITKAYTSDAWTSEDAELSVTCRAP